MELNVIGASPVQVSEAVFGAAFREDLVHQVVVAYRNAGRAGTKAQLNHTRMSGTTKKFKKQKGGGARHGDYRAPIFVGGARAFAAQPRDFAQKVNRKMYRGALCSMLAELKADGRVVLVAENAPEALYLAARNIPYLHVVDVAALDPVSLVGADKVVVTVESLKRIEEWLA